MNRTLYLLVFTAGLVTLGMELSAARLLEPAFGNSQIVWAAIIGLILLSLALGAWLGGALADRFPRRRDLDITLSAGAVAVALIPLLSTPVLHMAATGLADFALGLLAGALLAVGLLFIAPGILLGTATPWAVRLAVGEGRGAGGEMGDARGGGRGARGEMGDARGEGRGARGESSAGLAQVGQVGRVAGRMSAVATVGSLVGAFLPVLWLIPTFGTRWTFYLLALLLLAVVSLGALGRPHRWIPLAGLAVVLALAVFAQPAGVRAAWDDGRTGKIIFEDESLFNYIAVRQWGSERHLKLNDGIGIHSVDHPHALLSQGIWDYFLLAPLFRSAAGRPVPAAGSPAWMPQNLLQIGAAAGTVPGLYTAIYGTLPITGVELDPEILQVGRDYFAATWPNYTTVAADGRRFLDQLPADTRYDIIAVDAYRPPYIPFHLTTVEFFRLLQRRLDDDGVVAINVGRTPNNYALVDALAATLRQVFPSVFVIDEPGPPHTLANSLVVATQQPTTLAAFQANVDRLPVTFPPEFRRFAQACAANARPAQPPADAPIFTDDRSQVEQIVHGLIAQFLMQ